MVYAMLAIPRYFQFAAGIRWPGFKPCASWEPKSSRPFSPVAPKKFTSQPMEGGSTGDAGWTTRPLGSTMINGRLLRGLMILMLDSEKLMKVILSRQIIIE